MFINELNLYIDHFKKKFDDNFNLNPKQVKYMQTFKSNLLEGIDYYKELISEFKKESDQYISKMKDELDKATIALTKQNLCFANSE